MGPPATCPSEAQSAFGKLGGHADEGGDPHPEQGAGAAQGDSGGHAGNVAGADGGGQGGGQGLEMRDLAHILMAAVTAAYQLRGMIKTADLHQSHAYREIDAGAEQDQQGNSVFPQQPGNLAGDVREAGEQGFHSQSPFARGAATIIAVAA